MKKQPHITEQTKNNLRIAFWSLYAQKPIEKISIKEITELAGYNRGTFYLYYNDVYDLLHQIEEEILGKITDVLNDSLEKNDTFDLSGHSFRSDADI
jgi:AcrR family transcriptional regulator